MDTNYSAAIGILPFFCLTFKKLLNTIIFNEVQIRYHIHSILFSVTLINCFEFLTWENFAFKTIFNLISCQLTTLLFDKSTQIISSCSQDTDVFFFCYSWYNQNVLYKLCNLPHTVQSVQ